MDEDQSYLSTLSRSMSMALEEFYSEINVII